MHTSNGKQHTYLKWKKNNEDFIKKNGIAKSKFRKVYIVNPWIDQTKLFLLLSMSYQTFKT